jgi:hypothetical protein
VNIDQLLALVEDLSAFTTTEQLQRKLSQCRTAYDKLNSSRASAAQAEREKAKMLLAATARIQNKIAAIEFSSRCEAQRAIKAAATTPQEQFFATTALRRNP